MKILHAQWLLDSLDSGVLQADYSYQLPATYSALHSCYIFKSNSHLTPARSVGVGKKKEEEPFLSNLQVLNLTGMKIWDDVLLASGAMIVNRDEYYLQGILKNAAFGINNNETNFADLILFDPVVYARSYILSYGNSKFANQQNQSSRNTARAGKEKKSVPTISELEIRVLKHFSELQSRSDRKANSGPIVASIDWLTHVISLKEFVDVNSLDLFALPTDPVRYPTAFKADFEFDPTLKDVSGERYSKYDLVYFAQNMPGTNSSSSEPLSIGKIIGFSRRNEDNAPMVRVQTVDIEQEVRPLKHNRMLTIQQLTPVLNPITESTVEILVSTQQLTGKVVLLHRTGYVEVTGYTGNAKSASDASVHNSDKVFSTSLMLEDHWPLVPWNNNLYQQHDENSDKSDADDYGFHPSKKRKVNMRSSQDY